MFARNLLNATKYSNLALRTAALPPCYQQQRTMVSLKDLRIRMKSVESIKKITASMKLVASSRLKGAQENMEKNSRPFWAAVETIFAGRADKPEKNAKKLIVVLTSDKGLCGSINSSLVRATRTMLLENQHSKAFVVGEKGVAGLQRQFNDRFVGTATEIGGKFISFADCIPIAEQIAATECDEIEFLSNKFISLLSFEICSKTVNGKAAVETKGDFKDFEFEEDKKHVLNDYYEFYIASLLYSSLTENAAAELAARMSSMDNATRNAGDVLNALTLKYNRQRQAGITTELTEIISGAESIVEE